MKINFLTLLVGAGMCAFSVNAFANAMCQMDADCPNGQICCQTDFGAMCVEGDYPGECTGGGGGGGVTTCTAGQYNKNGTCVSCTSQTGHSSATSASGSTSITNCYLPRNTKGSNNYGSYTYTANCFYSV